MARLPVLESFDTPAPEDSSPPGPTPDWVSGHAAGLAEGLTLAEARQSALRDSLVQSIADLEFRYAEVRGHLLGALGPLFAALTDSVLPELARAGLAAWIAERLTETAETDLGRPVLLMLSPGDAGPVSAALAGLRLPSLRIIADPALADGQARLQSGQAETMLDGPALVAAARQALAALSQDPEPRSEHG